MRRFTNYLARIGPAGYKPGRMAGINYFSPQHRQFIEALFQQVRRHYGPNLVTLAVYGSYARGEARPNSDIDLLIVLDHVAEKGRRKRIGDFVRNVETPVDRIRLVSEKEGNAVDVSVLIVSKDEAQSFQPLYLDMAGYVVLLEDKNNFLKMRLDRVREKMKIWGSRKVEAGGHWYWDICPALKWGDVIDYDK